MNASDSTLFSSAGAEAAFGAAAEKHGVEEVNVTFDGHPDARNRDGLTDGTQVFYGVTSR